MTTQITATTPTLTTGTRAGYKKFWIAQDGTVTNFGTGAPEWAYKIGAAIRAGDRELAEKIARFNYGPEAVPPALA